MKIERKFTAIQIGSKTVNQTVEPTFEYGSISGPYYNEEHPKTEFDTEEDAIKWAYKEDSYSRWMIVPIVTFNNHKNE
jgi:hypothetical protein|tara:strand:- start:254 stop:487 length:234 start_codon:yes stop_codon:yes gene_type:complete